MFLAVLPNMFIVQRSSLLASSLAWQRQAKANLDNWVVTKKSSLVFEPCLNEFVYTKIEGSLRKC